MHSHFTVSIFKCAYNCDNYWNAVESNVNSHDSVTDEVEHFT